MKVKSLLGFAISLMVCFFLAGNLRSEAAAPQEILCNEIVTAALAECQEEKQYAFVVDKDGYFTIEMSKANPLDDAKLGWNVELCDASGKTVAEFERITTSFQSQKFNFKKNTKMYLRVYAYSQYNSNAPVNVSYNLQVVMAADSAWEQEENKDASCATLLPSNTVKKGSLLSGIDEDYYVYTVGKTGYFQYNFEKTNVLDDVNLGWQIDAYDVNGNLLDAYRTETNMTSHRYNFAKGTKVYFCVKAYSQYDVNAPVNVEYRFSVKETASTLWEVETNVKGDGNWADRIRGAKTLNGSYLYGSLWYNKDNDIYKLAVPKNGKVTLQFNTNNVEANVNGGYHVAIYNSKGEELKDYGYIKANSKFEFYAMKGTYYVEVKAELPVYIFDNYAPPATDAYTISATSKAVKVAAVKKKASYKSSKRLLKWKKVKKIDGYEIQFCKSKKFSKKKTTKYESDKNNYTLSYFMKKGTYYVRVRAYNTTISGVKIYGGFSKVVKIRIK